MVGNSTFLLDQMGHTVGGPQTGLVAQSFWTAFECLLDLAEILGAQARLAASPSSLLQSGAALDGQLRGPLTHRLAVCSHAPGHF